MPAGDKFLKELEEWSSRRGKKNPHETRISFLAVKEEVKAGIDAGHSAKLIWELLSEKGCIDCTYPTFCRHVRRHIKTKIENTTLRSPPKTERRESKDQENDESPIAGERSFQYSSSPNTEDLY